MNQQLFETITAWQGKTFTKATVLSCVNHLQEEIGELKQDVEAGKYYYDLHNEIADCFLLLFGVCNKADMKYEDVVKAIEDKMKINLERTWGEVNDKGYVKHV